MIGCLLSTNEPLAQGAKLRELDSIGEVPHEFADEYKDYQNVLEYMQKAKETEWADRMVQMCDKISHKAPEE